MKKLALILMALILALSAVPFAYAEEAEVKTFSMMASVEADDPDWNDYWFFDYIEETLGIRFDIIQVSAESFTEKVNLAFATGDLPDLLVGGLTSTDIAIYGDQGLILPLEEYITWENTPTIKAWFETIDGYEAALYYPDGHIYNLQGFMVIDREMSVQRYWINDVWCQQAIGKKPETLDEYYEYLKYVKENDMDGDGDATNEIPLAGRFTTFDRDTRDYYDSVLPILFAFGLTEHTLEFSDGVVRFNPAEPVFKEFLKYMNLLYSEGLLDNSYFTQTQDQYKAKLASGIVGAFNDWAHWLNIPAEEDWTQYTSNKPMTSEFNETPIWGARDLNLERNFIITNNCDDPVTLLKLADFIMTDTYDTPDNTLTAEHAAFIGEYEEHLVRASSGRLTQWRGAELGTWDEHPEWGWYWADLEDEMGTYQAVDVIFPEEYATMNEFLNAVMSPNCFPIPNCILERQSTVKENSLTEEVRTWNAPYYHVGWSNNIKLTAEEADEASLLYTDMIAYLDQMYGRFVTGDADIDAEFDSYVEGLKMRGMDRYVEIYQGAYDRWANGGEA